MGIAGHVQWTEVDEVGGVGGVGGVGWRRKMRGIILGKR